MTRLSPCVGLCRIEQPSGLCFGCARSPDEIADWPTLAESGRKEIWASLPERRLAIGIGLHRLPWGAQEIRDFVVASLVPRAGTWLFGVPGAVAEFLVGAGEAPALSVADDGVTAVTREGAIHVSGFRHMRALAIGPGPRSGNTGIIALVLPRETVPATPPPVLMDLGKDAEALGPGGHAECLYDLGLGASASRFCVRTSDPHLRRALNAARGTPWRSFLPRLGPPLAAASPTRVVLTPAGRAEVYTPFRRPAERTPWGLIRTSCGWRPPSDTRPRPGSAFRLAMRGGALHYPASNNRQEPSHDA